MSILEHVAPLPPDEIFGMAALIQNDPNPNKVDLTVGIYYNKNLQNRTMEAVKEAEKRLVRSEKNKVYLPLDGNQSFVQASRDLVFGVDFVHSEKHRFLGVQSLGGTNALRIGGELFRAEVTKSIYLSKPTWPNHPPIFLSSGLEITDYPYYNLETHQVDFLSILDCLQKAPEKSVILLHACCHNPTGCDLRREEWKELSVLMKKKNLIPLFDFAYQGFDQGVEEDAWAIRYFAEKGHEVFVAHSFSKFFGLYGERLGAFHALLKNEKTVQSVATVLKKNIRASFSNPPRHGPSLVSIIIRSQNLRQIWAKELKEMRSRIKEMRKEFVQALALECKQDRFHFLQDRHGMFALLGLKKETVDRLIENYSIYLTKNGRVNLTGLNRENITYVADALSKTLR